MSTKKCFVISPIGDDQSEVRKEADALLWVARSALEKYQFEVIRVDQIARSTTITNEIIQLIQEAELCLIVLTGENANVFYEAGRRHETGRPFIQLIKKGERIPFDVASIRTIIYEDIQALPSVARVVEQIQKFVEEFEKGGYGASGTGVSMSTIASALDRIERKVGQMGGGLIGSSVPGGSMLSANPLSFMNNPREAFMTAVAQGDLSGAALVLPRLGQLMGPSKEFVAAAGLLAVQGHEPAADMVYGLLADHFDELGEDDEGDRFGGFQTAVAALSQFYIATDREAEGITRVTPIVDKVVKLPGIDDHTKAHVLNQLQMLHYGAKQYEEALKLCEQVSALNPTEPAYVYNASLIYEKLHLASKALELVDQFMGMADIDAGHLSHAVKMYLDANRIVDARDAFAKLRQADPGKAAVLIFDPDVRRKLS